MQRIVDATLDAAVVTIVAAILFAFGIVAAVLKAGAFPAGRRPRPKRIMCAIDDALEPHRAWPGQAYPPAMTRSRWACTCLALPSRTSWLGVLPATPGSVSDRNHA